MSNYWRCYACGQIDDNFCISWRLIKSTEECPNDCAAYYRGIHAYCYIYYPYFLDPLIWDLLKYKSPNYKQHTLY